MSKPCFIMYISMLMLSCIQEQTFFDGQPAKKNKTTVTYIASVYEKNRHGNVKYFKLGQWAKYRIKRDAVEIICILRIVNFDGMNWVIEESISQISEKSNYFVKADGSICTYENAKPLFASLIPNPTGELKTSFEMHEINNKKIETVVQCFNDNKLNADVSLIFSYEIPAFLSGKTGGILKAQIGGFKIELIESGFDQK